MEDIEFLLGGNLPRLWVWGWCSIPGIVMPFTLWWMVVSFMKESDWREAPWESAGILAGVSAALILFMTFAAIAVARQVQYNFIAVRSLLYLYTY